MTKSKSSVSKEKSGKQKPKMNIEPEVLNCKNCEMQFSGNFCPNCGQSKKEFEKSLSFLIVDVAGNIFAFDTRFWKTLISLVVRPGSFAIEYLNGRRARYMSPLRLYIFISFIFFLLLSLLIKQNVSLDDEKLLAINESLDKHESNVKDDSLQIENKDTLLIEGFLPGSKVVFEKSDENSMKATKAIRQIVNDPSMYINRLIKYFSWSLFILMPVYALILWLFFHKKRKYYYGHLIMAINQHAFAFLLLAVILAFRLFLPDRTVYAENYLLLYMPVYMYIGLCKLYNGAYIRTFFKLSGIVFIYSFVLMISVAFISILWIYKEFL